MIISDTHGSLHTFYKLLKKEGKPDYLIHLGDVESQDQEIAQAVGCPCAFVGGNNDYFSNLPREVCIDIGETHRAFLTHGHRYHIYGGNTVDLKKAADSHFADIVMFGHTHRPVYEKEDGMLILNPGSLTLPRQLGRKPSYILLEVTKDDRIYGEIRYLE